MEEIRLRDYKGKYIDRGRKGTGVNCRNGNEYGQSFRRCYPIKRKRRFSVLQIRNTKKAEVMKDEFRK